LLRPAASALSARKGRSAWNTPVRLQLTSGANSPEIADTGDET